MRIRVVAAAVLLFACGRSEPRGPFPAPTGGLDPAAAQPNQPAAAPVSPTAAPTPASAPTVTCTRDESFPSLWNVPEASAAAEVELRPATKEVLVISDSGRNGAAMAWSKVGGLRPLVLPLDAAASDDLEGMTWLSDAAGARLYTLTSSGAVRVFVPDGKGGLRRAVDSYRIAPPPLSCADLHGINCGKNWEGLCLRSASAHARCAGYAASKTDTSLACVVRDDAGRLSIDPQRPPIQLSLDRWMRKEGVLSDCAFGAAGGPAEDVLLVTTNVYGGSQTYVVDESTGKTSPLEVQATASNEAIAIDHEGALYAFLDDNEETSAATRFECRGWSR